MKEQTKQTFAIAVDSCQSKYVIPVRCFELYLLKLNPGLNFLWQRPKQKAAAVENIWYEKVPAGKNMLGSLTKKLSKSAELSLEYTIKPLH